MRKPKRRQIERLPEPYDIEATFIAAQGQKTGEVKKAWAWWDGASLRHVVSLDDLDSFPQRTRIETKVITAGKGIVDEVQPVPCSPYLVAPCVVINEGDGYKIVEALAVEYWIRNAAKSQADDGTAEPSHLPPAGTRSEILNWLGDQKRELVALCQRVAAIDNRFHGCWHDHKDAITSGGRWPTDVALPHTVEIAIAAFFTLGVLGQRLTTGLPEWAYKTERPPMMVEVQAFAVRISKAAHHAGKHAQALEAIVSSHRTLSTLGAAKNVTRTIGARSQFLLEELAKLTERLGKKPSTLELMRHLDGKTDPESRKRITTFVDEDGTHMIQWSDNKRDRKTKQWFATKISELKGSVAPKEKRK